MSNNSPWDSNECKGCYPKCLTKPFIFFALIVIILFIIAFAFCSSCKPVEVKSPDISALQKPQIIQSPSIKEVEPIIELKKEEPKQEEPKVDNIVLIKEAFLKDGSIDNGFSLKDSVFFDKNSSFMTKKGKQNFNNAIQDEVNSAKLAIITGHACDLGNAKYNKFLIEKRINRIAKVLKDKNPNIEIITSNDGQVKSAKREKERRVDVYLYK